MIESPAETALNNTSLQVLRGVGAKLENQLQSLGIHSVQDILFHLPLRYEDRTQLIPMDAIKPGLRAVLCGEIEAVNTIRHRKVQLTCRLSDGKGVVLLRFFHFTAAQRNRMVVGSRLLCFGEIRLGRQGFEIAHPEYRQLAEDEAVCLEDRLTPIYSTTKGLSQRSWMNLTNQALQMLSQARVLAELLPNDILEKYQLPDIAEALQYIHRPPIEANLQELLDGRHVMQKRLIIEEMLSHRLALLQVRERNKTHRSNPIAMQTAATNAFLSVLPFQLTSAQQRVIKEIQEDLQHAYPMMRLVQGDVGSGKTVVAAVAMVQAVAAGFQAVMMAPTELLAEQHYRVIKQWLSDLNIEVVFLSGSLKAKERREVLAKMHSGAAQVIVGTHALFQEGVEFHRLNLVIVDEQHRFGVQQRLLLRDKGKDDASTPHQLIMTATPIPRTLAMSAYADLDCSVIDELPPGRKPVQTVALSNGKREEVIHRIQEVCASGRQVYWVCPLIEESELLQCQAAEECVQVLRAALPHLTIDLVHGRMKPAEKEAAMTSFKSGDTHVLVATTVIEVGVDVPNATLMVIENAERLGLSQLHQLRGRVGRGAEKSFCVLLYQAPLSQTAKSRITIMRETNDGFKIAEKDLELRGPGEVLGTRQTGAVGMKIANIVRDQQLLPEVQRISLDMMQSNSAMCQALISRWVGIKEQFGSV